MKKTNEIKVHKIQMRTLNNKPLYTIRFIIFDPKRHFVSTPEAKDLCRKDMHCSKKKMDEEYDSLFGSWIKVGRGKNTHVEFNKTTKNAANVIFIVPKNTVEKHGGQSTSRRSLIVSSRLLLNNYI